MALAEKIHEGLKKHIEKSKERKGKEKSEKKKEIHHFEVHPMQGGHMLVRHHKHPMGGTEEGEKSMHKSMAGVSKAMKEECSCGNCDETDTGVAVGSSQKQGKEMDDED